MYINVVLYNVNTCKYLYWSGVNLPKEFNKTRLPVLRGGGGALVDTDDLRRWIGQGFLCWGRTLVDTDDFSRWEGQGFLLWTRKLLDTDDFGRWKWQVSFFDGGHFSIKATFLLHKGGLIRRGLLHHQWGVGLCPAFCLICILNEEK